MRRARALPWAAALALVSYAHAHAQTLTIDPAHERVVHVAADLDDDDEDGVLDARASQPPEHDLWRLAVPGRGPFTLTSEGPIAILREGVRASPPLTVASATGLFVQALEPGEAVLRVRGAEHEATLKLAIHGLRVLDGQNRPLDPSRDALGVSRHITHDRALPRTQREDDVSDDPDALRIELVGSPSGPEALFARLEARSGDGEVHVLRHVPLLRTSDGARYRSPFLRLVSDATDASAPEVSPQVLRVHLRDHVEAVVTWGADELRTSLRVGRPGKEGGPRSALRGVLRMTVLRATPAGAPVLGADDVEAAALARSQVEIANEIWAQCFVTFGSPARTEVRVVDPPPSALLAVADVDGLPARGGGAIVFRANGVRIGPLATRAGALPEATARDIARALVSRGFSPEVTLNPRTEMGAGPSADVVVRDAHGGPVSLSVDPAAPLSSDAQQRLDLGVVNLIDGIQEFDNSLAATGTLEERTLLKLLMDRDPTTIDVLLINHFVNRDRQGEAFIEADGSSMANALVFDRNAVRYDRQAWVQAHELGHVLLDEAFHPDSIGPDEPWLLMDADAQRGRVTGPKRLRAEDCARVRRRSGPSAHPPLLAPAP